MSWLHQKKRQQLPTRTQGAGILIPSDITFRIYLCCMGSISNKIDFERKMWNHLYYIFHWNWSGRPRRFWHLNISSVKVPTLICTFCVRIPLFPTPWGGNLYILNVRTAFGSEHHCHNPTWVGCQKAVRILWVACRGPPWGSHWLVHKIWPLSIFKNNTDT